MVPPSDLLPSFSCRPPDYMFCRCMYQDWFHTCRTQMDIGESEPFLGNKANDDSYWSYSPSHELPCPARQLAALQRWRHRFDHVFRHPTLQKQQNVVVWTAKSLNLELASNSSLPRAQLQFWTLYQVFHDGVDKLILHPLNCVRSIGKSWRVSSKRDRSSVLNVQPKMLQYFIFSIHSNSYEQRWKLSSRHQCLIIEQL